MSPLLTVIICTHNPRADYLDLTLASLRAQEPLDEGDWELVVIDNASHPAVEAILDLSWRPGARIVREERLGLSHARLRGFHEARGEILVFVDDDNLLDPDYLRRAHLAMSADPTLGAIGGKSIPRYEVVPPAWFHNLGLDLACRDLGEAVEYAAWRQDGSPRIYPRCAPIGAGLVGRRSAYEAYVTAAENDPVRTSLGRRGADLASGEDNDIVMTMLELGWRVAYLPELRLEHLIPSGRLVEAYLASYAYSSNLTWLKVLDIHGIRPWPRVARWTVPLRKVRRYVTMSAWRGRENFVRWRGLCGRLDGQTLLGRQAVP